MPITKLRVLLTDWSVLAPLLTWLALLSEFFLKHSFALPSLVLIACLLSSVLAAVKHADAVAHHVGQPFGTLILAVAITIIEVALIASLLLVDGQSAATLPRDTVFATVMIILNGIVGLCLLWGGSRFGEQNFDLHGVSAALATLAAIVVLTLVLPNYTTTLNGPVYSNSQLIFVAVVSLVLYCTFVLVQTVLHKHHFEPKGEKKNELEQPPSHGLRLSLVFLVIALAAVVLLGKSLSPTIESMVREWGAPHAVVGIIIAAVVLMPEGFSAVKAAREDNLQTSLNLALGSALASIGLTIPTVAVISIFTDLTLVLGIDLKSMVLLSLSLLVATLSLSKGLTTVLQGAVHLVIFAVYLFMSIVP